MIDLNAGRGVLQIEMLLFDMMLLFINDFGLSV
jgi:hypothetical protein